MIVNNLVPLLIGRDPARVEDMWQHHHAAEALAVAANPTSGSQVMLRLGPDDAAS